MSASCNTQSVFCVRDRRVRGSGDDCLRESKELYCHSSHVKAYSTKKDLSSRPWCKMLLKMTTVKHTCQYVVQNKEVAVKMQTTKYKAINRQTLCK